MHSLLLSNLNSIANETVQLNLHLFCCSPGHVFHSRPHVQLPGLVEDVHHHQGRSLHTRSIPMPQHFVQCQILRSFPCMRNRTAMTCKNSWLRRDSNLGMSQVQGYFLWRHLAFMTFEAITLVWYFGTVILCLPLKYTSPRIFFALKKCWPFWPETMMEIDFGLPKTQKARHGNIFSVDLNLWWRWLFDAPKSWNLRTTSTRHPSFAHRCVNELC